MRYSCLCGILVLLLFCGGHVLYAQEEGWEATDLNGSIFFPIRSLRGGGDSILTITMTSRIIGPGDSSVLRWQYQPLMIPLDSLLEVRKVRSNHAIDGGLIGLAAGILVPLVAGGSDDASGRFYGSMGFGTLVGAMIGLGVGGDVFYDLDQFSPGDRGRLMQSILPEATPDELTPRSADTYEDDGRKRGKRWSRWWVSAGAGPGEWAAGIFTADRREAVRTADERPVSLVPRFSFGTERQGVLLTGSVLVSSYEFVDAVTSEGTLFLWDFLGISVTGYSSFSAKGIFPGLALSTKFGSLR